jgi:hypothetical protein
MNREAELSFCSEGWLVGRSIESGAILDALESAQDGQTARLWLEGEPGAGKTALCRWAREQATGFTQVTISCVEGEGETRASPIVLSQNPNGVHGRVRISL